jgi:hypothetical protein
VFTARYGPNLLSTARIYFPFSRWLNERELNTNGVLQIFKDGDPRHRTPARIQKPETQYKVSVRVGCMESLTEDHKTTIS